MIAIRRINKSEFQQQNKIEKTVHLQIYKEFFDENKTFK